ncbi:hypothetical protein AMATHDRAFT_50851 [Amanita thiersii Skay4041]|uniref:Uncharacterized protein n=1 Tax=Amanita thiersii Skay4041 TaxID=703135 RepID=A0A2A9NG78_9AGAR|nr:hypothetical protein AMATHDRAFT_50851 [Amanita thiersii Skay4041]
MKFADYGASLCILRPFEGTGIYSLTVLSQLKMGDTVFAGSQVPALQSFFSLTLVTNGLCANLIAYKIWKTQRCMEQAIPGYVMSAGQRSLSRLWIIILESGRLFLRRLNGNSNGSSGAIYWAALLAMLAAYITDAAPAFLICLDIMSPVIGIVFSLIIVRVSLGLKPDGTEGQSFSTVLLTSVGHVTSAGISVDTLTVERPATLPRNFSPKLTATTPTKAGKSNSLKNGSEFPRRHKKQMFPALPDSVHKRW